MRVVVERDEAGIVGLAPYFFVCEFDDGEFETFGGAEVIAPFVVPNTQDGGVGCEEDGRAAGGFGAFDDAFLENAVFHGVKLDGVRDGSDSGACGSDFFDGVVGEGADSHVDAFLCASSAGGLLAFQVRHCL